MTTLPFAVPSDLNQWAQDFEIEGGYPASDTPALIAWGQAEGGSFDNSAYGNVLNTTLGETGSSSINADGVQSYDIAGDTTAQDWLTGIDADISTIKQPNMAAIQGALQSGDPTQLPSALASDPWGTNPALVAQILGESSAQISALGAAGSGSNSATLTGAFGIPGLPSFLDPSSDLGDIEDFLAKAILVVAGVGIMILGAWRLAQRGESDASQKAAPAIGPIVEAAAA